MTGVLSLEHLDNKMKFISIGLDHVIQVSFNDGTLSKTLLGHNERILGALELDSGQLVSVSRDGVIIFWDVQTY